MTFCTDIYGIQRMNTDLRGPLIFHLVPPAGQSFLHLLYVTDFSDPLSFPIAKQ